MLFKVLLALLVIIIAIMTQFEVDEDVLIAEKTAALPANRIKIFQRISNMKYYYTWFPGLGELLETDHSNVGIGKQFMEIQEYSGYGRVDYTYVVIGYESPRYISYIVNSWIQPRYELLVERRDEEGSKTSSKRYPAALTFRMHTRRRSYLTRYLLAPAANLYYSYNMRQALLGLKYSFQ